MIKRLLTWAQEAVYSTPIPKDRDLWIAFTVFGAIMGIVLVASITINPLVLLIGAFTLPVFALRLYLEMKRRK